ncbi:MAG: ectonucleotide pyrophosphatase/phosphodiesterase [Bacteroidota bacterium]
MLVLLLLMGAGVAGCSSNKSAPNKLLLISFDGFRYDYLSKTHTPNFDLLIRNGVQSEGLIPVFPSKTFPNHYSIATGLYPQHSGLIGNSMYDPVFDARYSIGNREAVEDARWYEGEPIWNTVEKQGLKAGTMFWVGSEAPIQDMRPTYWKRYDGSVPDSARIDTVISWFINEDKPIDFGTLYFDFVDGAGHRFGPDSDEVVEAIRRADALMGYLVEQLEDKGLFAQTNMLIVSDHGMQEISKDRLVLLDDFIDMDDVTWVESSPSVMLRVKQGKLNAVYNALKEHGRHFEVWKRNELPERFGLKYHRRTPELILSAHEGYTISSRAYVERRPGYPSGGTHGFDPVQKNMHAIFVAHGPDIASGRTISEFESIHLYELMCRLLGLEPSKNDGKLEATNQIRP